VNSRLEKSDCFPLKLLQKQGLILPVLGLRIKAHKIREVHHAVTDAFCCIHAKLLISCI